MDEVRRIALSMPEAEEAEHQGRPSFCVEGKVYATLWDSIHMNVMLKPEEIYAAIEQNPGACTEFIEGGRPKALYVDLRRATPKALEKLLRQAWAAKAPKRLAPATTSK
ncbi:MAG: MmcQ/YjbR family DNA-binding protein [Chloroflexi bacterium]|nr:MmcQ/YjbR family DNA-binding protein [Chloroflexota bacterium]